MEHCARQQNELVVEALLANPDGMLARLEGASDDTCKAVKMDVDRAILDLKSAATVSAKLFTVAVGVALKSMAQVMEGLKGVSATLDALASVCRCAVLHDDTELVMAALKEARRSHQLSLVLQDVSAAPYQPPRALELDAGDLCDGGQLEQWVDVPTCDDCTLMCVLDPAPRLWLRGQHTYVLHMNAVSVDKFTNASATFQLLPEDVSVAIDGDASATCAILMCEPRTEADGCWFMLTYAASLEADQVALTIFAFGVPVFHQLLVR